LRLNQLVNRVLLVCYLVLLSLTSLWPTPVDNGGLVRQITSTVLKFCHEISWLRWLQYNQLEALANVLLYLPLGVFLVVLFPKLRLRWTMMIPVVVSILAEVIQRFYLPSRYSTLDDVYHNALGGVIGVIISASTRRWLRLKSQRRLG